MFDRFEVAGSASPIGLRGAVFAVGVHGAILALGLRSAHVRQEPLRPQIHDTIWLSVAPAHSSVSPVGPAVPEPGPISDPLPPVPHVPGPLPPHDPVVFHPDSRWSPGPIEPDSTGLYSSEGSILEQYPELLSAPPPRYPDLLRQAGIQGVVIIEAVVDTLGRVERPSLRVIASPHPALSASAEASVAAAVFRPGRVDGHAVRVLVQVPVRFTISGH